jgi:hypothetical protein
MRSLSRAEQAQCHPLHTCFHWLCHCAESSKPLCHCHASVDDGTPSAKYVHIEFDEFGMSSRSIQYLSFSILILKPCLFVSLHLLNTANRACTQRRHSTGGWQVDVWRLAFGVWRGLDLSWCCTRSSTRPFGWPAYPTPPNARIRLAGFWQVTAHVKPGVHLPVDEPTTRTCLLETAGISLRAHVRHSPQICPLGGCVIPFLKPQNCFLLGSLELIKGPRSSFGSSFTNMALCVQVLRGILVAQAQGFACHVWISEIGFRCLALAD